MVQANVVAAVAPEADVPVTVTVRVPGVRPVPVISPARAGGAAAGRRSPPSRSTGDGEDGGPA
jgi:hypothetical protein